MGREMGGMFKREGKYVYLWLIHVDVWQKPTKFCKAIILQLKKKTLLKMFLGDLTGGPMFKTLCCQCRGCWLDPWLGTKVLHAVWPKDFLLSSLN